MIEVVAHLELAVNRENFDAVYLLSEEASIVEKVERPNLSIDMESLKSTLIQAMKVSPHPIDFILNYQNHMVIMEPIKPVLFKGGSARIPNVSYIIAILPPARTFRKKVNDLIRHLAAPFFIPEKSEAKKRDDAQRKLTEEKSRKQLAEKVLKDLDKI